MPKLTVTRIPKMNTVVMKQDEGSHFFIATSDSIVISIPMLSSILQYLVCNDIMSYKVLQGLLEEYHSTRE
jgi:hypothetical protein